MGMASRLAHRATGVESMAVRNGSSVAFGAGAQISVAEGRDCVVVASGWNSLGQSVAQRLTEAYLSENLSSFAEVEGEFAGVILDKQRDAVLLVRDRVGSRPLYFAKVGRDFIFASEYKALLAFDKISRDIDQRSLAELHRSKAVPSGRTLFSSIVQVPPASVVTLSQGSCNETRYWSPELLVDPSMQLETGAEQLADLLVAAMDRRRSFTGSGDIGLALSGGIDSMVLRGAAVHAGIRPRTFTIGDSPDDPEIAWAEKLAQHFGTQHVDRVLETGDLLGELPHLVWAMEDPIARTETLLTLQLCRMAKDTGTTSMIRGDGSDGLFGGMSRHKLLALGGRWKPLAPDIWQVYTYTQRGVRPSRPIARIAVETLLRDHIPPLPVQSVSGVEEAHLAPPKFDEELLNRVLMSGPAHSLPILLQKAERPSSLYQIIPTAPFTDKPTMDFAFKVPSRLKHDGSRDKIILRRAASRLLPKEFVERPKYPQRIRETRGFCETLRTIAEHLDVVTALPRRGGFNKQRISQLLHEPTTKPWAPEHAMRVWTLILTEIWFRTFVDEDGSKPVAL